MFCQLGIGSIMEKSICTFLFVLELVGPVYADEIKMNSKLGGDKFGKTVHFKKMIICALG